MAVDFVVGRSEARSGRDSSYSRRRYQKNIVEYLSLRSLGPLSPLASLLPVLADPIFLRPSESEVHRTPAVPTACSKISTHLEIPATRSLGILLSSDERLQSHMCLPAGREDWSALGATFEGLLPTLCSHQSFKTIDEAAQLGKNRRTSALQNYR